MLSNIYSTAITCAASRPRLTEDRIIAGTRHTVLGAGRDYYLGKVPQGPAVTRCQHDHLSRTGRHALLDAVHDVERQRLNCPRRVRAELD
jgi:hypothetical protein